MAEPTTLPTMSLETLVQPVTSMLRNCLITANPKLKELDFTHLQMYIDSITPNDGLVKGQVLIKAGSENRYRLETKQIFNYTRIDADTALNELGFTSREFTKSQYADVQKLVQSIGTLTVVEGEIGSEVGDAVVSFVFGDTMKELAPSRYLDLAALAKVKSHYDIAFKGVVKFTFKGSIEAPKEEPKQEESEDLEAIDVSTLFPHRQLGKILGRQSSQDDVYRPQ